MSAARPEYAEILLADPRPACLTTNFDDDQFGRSLVLSVGQARQVFRWIEAGRFLMGSPPDEPARLL